MIFAARIGAREGFDEFTINGSAFSMDKMEPMFSFALGKRYRLHMINATEYPSGSPPGCGHRV